MSRRRPTPRPAVCGHFLPANKQITRQLSSSSGGNYRSFGSLQWGHSGDTGPRGTTLPGELFPGSLNWIVSSRATIQRDSSAILVIWSFAVSGLIVIILLVSRFNSSERNAVSGETGEQLFQLVALAHQQWLPTMVGFRLPRQGCSVKVVVAVGDGTATARRSASKSPQMSHRLT